MMKIGKEGPIVIKVTETARTYLGDIMSKKGGKHLRMYLSAG